MDSSMDSSSSSGSLIEDDRAYSRLFHKIRDLGAGAHGSVQLVEHRSSGDLYALKKIRIENPNPKSLMAALPEVEVLCRLTHTNITRLHGAWRSHESKNVHSLNILMEYADGGTLAEAIKARSLLRRPFDEDTVLDWFVQIASALAYMHGSNIIHRDLKVCIASLV